MRNIGERSGRGVCDNLCLINDCAPANRIGRPCPQFSPCIIIGREQHTIGMERQPLLAVEDQIARFIKIDAVDAVKPDLTGISDRLDHRNRGVWANGIWPLPGKPEQDRIISSMALTRKRE